MTSEKRILAARANGALSRGPKTPEGKARSSQNALRHGLLAKCVLLRNENSENFQTLFQMYLDRFSPVDDIEMGLVEEMVASYWRLRRAMTIETRMIDVEMEARHSGSELDRLTAAFGELATSPKLNVLYRYQTRLHLMHSRALRDLAMMRQKLPYNPTASSPEAEVSAEPNEPKPPSESEPIQSSGDSPVPNEPKNPLIRVAGPNPVPAERPQIVPTTAPLAPPDPRPPAPGPASKASPAASPALLLSGNSAELRHEEPGNE